MANDWLKLLSVAGFAPGADRGDDERVNDCQLLDRFLSRGDVSALEAIVRRHGPLVLSVCRRILRKDQDVEDAFQATFLVLVRKAPRLAGVEAIGNWLYGVSYRTALRLRAAAWRAAELERRYSQHAVASSPALPPEGGADLAAVLDREVHGLPRKYREPIVLCLMQDLSRAEAARRLGVKEGTLSGRLARAREMLAGRLRRRGIVLSTAGLSISLSVCTANAVVPPGLISAVVRSGGVAVSRATPPPVVPATVVRLQEEIVREMGRVKAAVWLTVGGSFLSVGLLAAALVTKAPEKVPGHPVPTARAPDRLPPNPRSPAAGTPPPADRAARSSHRKLIEDTRWVLSEVDAAGGALSATDSPQSRAGFVAKLVPRGDGVAAAGVRLERLPVAPAVVVFVDGLPAKPDDLRPGMFAELKLDDPGHVVETITATRPRSALLSCVLERIEPDRRQIWVRVAETNLLVEALEVAADAKIFQLKPVGAGPDSHLMAVPLQDLVVGMSLSLNVKARPGGRLTVTQIQTGMTRAAPGR